ncbi:phosphate ABC transporter permease subunit PstC [Marinicauda salina]|uniref:Phosphate transport system permease protein n=1 Tax=Marinicauda salina TaxID=2135793 RepID=A0A2U2BXV6_9PROT|nr:phosphate ABC transporter permease subunit PstC [Marinicauda salina]PWE18827.1 phosphate ABC transporter permease subunit PstC [Marinicauda salina]
MQAALFTALALVVLTAIGLLVGRRRAFAAAAGAPVRLHSLPSYHGYFVALWTGAPAAVLLALYGVFGATIVDSLTMAELQEEAAPLLRAYEERLAGDAEIAALREDEARIAEALAAARSESGAHETINRLSRERTTVADSLARQRREIAAETAARAPDSEAGLRARAGFEYALAPRERRQLFIADARALAFGEGTASRDAPTLRAAARAMRPLESRMKWGVAGGAIALALAGFAWARSRVGPDFRARNRVERVVGGVLMLASAIAILTTLGIVLSLLFESLRFFESIDWRLHEFLFGTQWSPQIAIRDDQVGQSGAFGAVPLFAGTGLITLIAMAVAVPVGLMSAIYLSEYAGSTMRAWAKPMLEILAGIPTVVYGFFALLTVGPFLRDLALFLGYEDAVTQSALSAGLVMGVMIIPFVSSLSDDVINAVPQALRDGSYAMGATKSETVRGVVVPAALPGIVGAVLLAVSRAVGETMIVVMAAGQGANLTANPLEAVTTITVQIVMLLTGDQEFDSPKTLSAFALGLVLFALTLIFNIIALRVVQRFREKYD